MLTVTNNNVELGRVKFGVPHNFVYKMRNDGNQTVKIKKIVVSCTSCTSAETRDSILSPGQEGTINVTFTPGSTGIASKALDVSYAVEETLMPALKLKFKAIVYD